MPLTGPAHNPDSGTVRRVVVFLHGYGADGHDLIGLAPIFAQFLPDTAFYAPHAPDPCEMAPFGRQWFSLAAWDPDEMRRDPEHMGRLHQAMLAGTREAAPVLSRYLDQLLGGHGLSERDLALVGFSQGTMMALHVALRRANPVAALLGYSGALVGADELPGEITARPPVRLVHGDADPVVPVQALEAARAALDANGVPVDSHVRPGLGHGIDEEAVRLGVEFLVQKLRTQPVD